MTHDPAPRYRRRRPCHRGGVAHDDLPTLMAAGIIAYLAETLLHEAVGHGGVCLAQGHRFTMLAPLWMRCSVSTTLLVAAGPGANVVAALICFTMLRLAPPRRALPGLLLWLGFTFNALVASGYLMVGALTGFGDWPALFADVDPPFLWRVPASLAAFAATYVCLETAASLFRRLAGSGGLARRRLWRRASGPLPARRSSPVRRNWPAARSARCPCFWRWAARWRWGFSLTSQTDGLSLAQAADRDAGPVARSGWLIALAAMAGAAFIILVGPGLDLTHRP